MAFYQFIQTAGSREAHVYIYGDLVTERWSEEEVSALSFKNQLDGLDVDTLHVHVDSYGGAVSEGFAIYNAIKAHPAKVITYADGFVASAAVYPFLAGDERIASPLSAFFLHRVLTSCYGNAEELRRAADEAEQLNDIGLNAFAAAGVDKDTILQLEEAETWLSPDKALELGIATAISEPVTASGPAQSVRSMIAQLLTSAPAPAPTPEPIPAPAPPKQTLFNILSKSFNNI